MKFWRFLSAFLVFSLLFIFTGDALAQTYLFSMDQLTVHVYWQEDGSVALAYEIILSNDPSADNIDYVDVGLPNSNFDISRMSADVDGNPVYDISSSGYMGEGSGVAIGLGPYAIRPGKTGTVHFFAEGITGVLYPDSQEDQYASGVFAPVYFGKQYLTGDTDMMVIFHLPPGVKSEEPRWHASPSGWPSEPVAGMDEDGRVTYTWANPNAKGYIYYEFGASFPTIYIPESTVKSPGFLERIGLSFDDFFGYLLCCGIGFFIILISGLSANAANKRKMQYLPPKMAIEGHGIKRGLTAVESAILLEQPMDKILTMILFATIKKGAAEVATKEPLALKMTQPAPEGLQEYETMFLEAFSTENKKERRKKLQDLMIALVKSVTAKMKGFSRKETIAYYKGIVERAWKQVEQAQTPEVKSAKYDEVMEWTMMDRDYEDRTREVFRTGPIYVPTWWGRYDPGFGRPSSTTVSTGAPASGGSSSSPSMSMPTLPGSSFAASVIGGVQSFSSGVIGNINDFTSGVTSRTNPIPVSTSTSRPPGSFRSGGGGGSSCACACACAGCACACAGGGR